VERVVDHAARLHAATSTAPANTRVSPIALAPPTSGPVFASSGGREGGTVVAVVVGAVEGTVLGAVEGAVDGTVETVVVDSVVVVDEVVVGFGGWQVVRAGGHVVGVVIRLLRRIRATPSRRRGHRYGTCIGHPASSLRPTSQPVPTS
jgi:hypothetical protein